MFRLHMALERFRPNLDATLLETEERVSICLRLLPTYCLYIFCTP